MLTIHHLGISQSERIIWLCEELGVPYELKVYERDATTRLAPAEYKALHPLGTAPVITDGALTLAESGAIIEYIIRKYASGRLIPGPADPGLADYLFWFHGANGTLMQAEMLRMFALFLSLPNDIPVLNSITGRADLFYGMMEAQLGKGPYLAGSEFTAADIITFFPLTTMRAFAPREFAAYPHIRAYMKRIGERPAYQRAMAKGDPGMELLLS
jgi:glutathione S-transferase